MILIFLFSQNISRPCNPQGWMWDCNTRLYALRQLCHISGGFTGGLTQTLDSGDVWVQREINALAWKELNSHRENVWVVILDCDDVWGQCGTPVSSSPPPLQPHQMNPQSRWDPRAVHVKQLLEETPPPTPFSAANGLLLFSPWMSFPEVGLWDRQKWLWGQGL